MLRAWPRMKLQEPPLPLPANAKTELRRDGQDPHYLRMVCWNCRCVLIGESRCISTLAVTSPCMSRLV
eukprot:26133_5